MFSNSITSPIYLGCGALCYGDLNLLLLTSMEDWLPVPDVASSAGTMEMLGQYFISKRKHPSTQGSSFISVCPSVHPATQPCEPAVQGHCQFSLFKATSLSFHLCLSPARSSHFRERHSTEQNWPFTETVSPEENLRIPSRFNPSHSQSIVSYQAI